MLEQAVTLYTKNDCQPCKRMKTELDLRGVIYTEVNMSEDPVARDFVVSLGHQQAPVVYIDTPDSITHWSGMDPNALKAHFGERPKAAA